MVATGAGGNGEYWAKEETSSGEMRQSQGSAALLSVLGCGLELGYASGSLLFSPHTRKGATVGCNVPSWTYCGDRAPVCLCIRASRCPP